MNMSNIQMGNMNDMNMQQQQMGPNQINPIGQMNLKRKSSLPG